MDLIEIRNSKQQRVVYVALLVPIVISALGLCAAFFGYSSNFDNLMFIGVATLMFFYTTWIGYVLLLVYYIFIIRTYVIHRTFSKTVLFYGICCVLIAPIVILILLGVSIRASKISLGPF